MSAGVAVAPIEPVSVRLRRLVVKAAGEAVLTCTFAPGGRLHGVGIRSDFYCAHCGQSLMWHEVAEGAIAVATAEEIIRSAGGSRQGVSL